MAKKKNTNINLLCTINDLIYLIKHQLQLFLLGCGNNLSYILLLQMHSIRKVFASTARLRVPLTAARQPMPAAAAAILPPQQLSHPPVAPLRQLSSSAVRQSAEHVWSLGRLNHVAIAVPDLEAATETYKTMGATVSEPQVRQWGPMRLNLGSSLYLRQLIMTFQALPEHGVTVVFIELPNTKLELLHPLGENSPIAGFLAKNKMGEFV